MDKKVQTMVTILIKGVYITIRPGLAHWDRKVISAGRLIVGRSGDCCMNIESI